MRVGVFQFRGSDSIPDNHEAIKRAITEAARNKVRLLVFQECAASGYPPVETPAVERIDFECLSSYFEDIRQLAGKYDMYIALGTVRKHSSRVYNSIRLIGPDGELVGDYDKRALWGWDLDNFTKGETAGIYEIDGIMTGFRICFEVRFPEYFRELFRSSVQVCFVSFCDVLEQDSKERYDIIKAHLVTRAVENVMTVVSVNSISRHQTAPTAVIDPDGRIVSEAPRNQEYLLIYDYEPPEVGYGAKGRIQNSLELMGQETKEWNRR